MSEHSQDFEVSEYLRPNSPQTLEPVTPIDVGSDAHIPQTSLRSKRKLFVLSSFAFSIGALLILFNSPFKNDFLAPGPLSSPHANILKGTDRCSACHEAGSVSVTQWTQDLFTGGSHLGVNQSDKCMECHDQSFSNEFALNAHNLSRGELTELTAAHKNLFQQASFDTSRIFQPPTNEHGEIACSACHKEHHGAQISLTELTDQQCQSCHQNVFHSFEADHPEFTNWPQKRRERIAFDHVTHMAKHFPGKKTEFSCSQCHVDDDFQNVKLLAGYEQSCAACHDQQIVNSSQKGMQLFMLPMVDINSIASAKRSIGQWPESATGGFDGPISPLMRTLLSSNPKAANLLNKYGAEFDFADIDPDDFAQVHDAVDLVWHIKELFYELSLSGSAAIESRLAKVAGRSVDPREIAMLTQGINEAVFQEAARRWLPDLNQEIPAHREGTIDIAVTWLPTQEDDLFYFVSRDEDQLAPNPLKHLLDAKQKETPVNTGSLANPGPLVRTNDRQSNRPESPVRTLSESDRVDRAGGTQLNQYVDENHPDTLIANPLRDLLESRGDGRVSVANGAAQQPAQPVDTGERLVNENQQVIVPDQEGPDLLEPNPLKTLLGSGGGEPAPLEFPELETDIVKEVTPPQVPDSRQQYSPSPMTNEVPGVVSVNAKSGWFRDDLNLAITYRPKGHADRFLVSWTNYVTSVPNADSRLETRHLFEKMTSAVDGVGLCRSCHTVDQLQSSGTEALFTTNWAARYRDATLRDFTKFSHGPHLLNADCDSCHKLDPGSSNIEKFAHFSASHSSSNFEPITKNQCASCHAEGRADNSCTTCHSYHLGTKAMKKADWHSSESP